MNTFDVKSDIGPQCSGTQPGNALRHAIINVDITNAEENLQKLTIKFPNLRKYPVFQLSMKKSFVHSHRSKK